MSEREVVLKRGESLIGERLTRETKECELFLVKFANLGGRRPGVSFSAGPDLASTLRASDSLNAGEGSAIGSTSTAVLQVGGSVNAFESLSTVNSASLFVGSDAERSAGEVATSTGATGRSGSDFTLLGGLVAGELLSVGSGSASGGVGGAIGTNGGGPDIAVTGTEVAEARGTEIVEDSRVGRVLAVGITLGGILAVGSYTSTLHVYGRARVGISAVEETTASGVVVSTGSTGSTSANAVGAFTVVALLG